MLIETFVETSLARGAVDKASVEVLVGTPTGWGHQVRHTKRSLPKRVTSLRPLRKGWKQIANR